MSNMLQYKLVVIIALFVSTAAAHVKEVHRAITVNAASAAYAASTSYKDFLYAVSSDVDIADATNAMTWGSYFEDNVSFDAGGKRPLNHFYDPLTGQGLSNFPPDDRIKPYGVDSFSWGSKLDCPGVKFYIMGNIGTFNEWSWQNARAYEWQGLLTGHLDRLHFCRRHNGSML